MGSRRKPLVGIIHSASSKATTTGDDLAVYLGVCLQLGGYSDVRIVGFNGSSSSSSSSNTGSSSSSSNTGSSSSTGNSGSSGSSGSKPKEASAPTAAASAPSHGKFSVVPYGGSKPEHPNHAECCRDTWESLAKCDMILICVDPPDTSACAKALSAVVKKGSDKAIVNFDLGVRNHVAAEEHLSNHGIVFLGGAVGISVARSPVNSHLQCLAAGSLVVERLTKKQSKQGVKFIDLLRSGGIPLRHCKNVTCYTHGVVVFNSVHAAAALAGVPLQDLLRDRHARLLWAAMIREGLQVLTLAAGRGDWRAANPCCSATLPQLELMLCLPTPLFVLVSRLLLRIPPILAPAMQTDLAAGRETNVAWTLEEIVRIADKHKVPAPACSTLSSALKGCVLRGDGVPSTPAEDLPLAYALRAGGSESNLALQLKLTVWCSSTAAGATALGWIGGPWLAAGGSMLVFFFAVMKYVIVGDIVP